MKSLEPITYKQVLDQEGSLTALEIWQGNQYITILLAGSGSHKNGLRWDEIKGTVDYLANEAKEKAERYLSESMKKYLPKPTKQD